jgi:hypothetical protein
VVSTGRTVQAEGVGLYGAGLYGCTYVHFPNREGGSPRRVRRGKIEILDYTRLRSIYKHSTVKASNTPHCRKAVKALGATLY